MTIEEFRDKISLRYDELVDKYMFELINEYRKNIIKISVILICAVIALFWTTLSIVMFDGGKGWITFLSVLISIGLCILAIYVYMKNDKGQIVTPLKRIVYKKILEETNFADSFIADVGVSKNDYINYRFMDPYFNTYSSENLIVKKVKNAVYTASNIECKVLNEESKSLKDLDTVFSGMIFSLKFEKEIATDAINILADKEREIFKPNVDEKYKIELDSVEFEREFDLYSKNRTRALEILTPTDIEEVLNLKNTLRSSYEISIIGNTVTIRIPNKKLFDLSHAEVNIENLKGNNEVKRVFINDMVYIRHCLVALGKLGAEFLDEF